MNTCRFLYLVILVLLLTACSSGEPQSNSTTVTALMQTAESKVQLTLTAEVPPTVSPTETLVPSPSPSTTSLPTALPSPVIDRPTATPVAYAYTSACDMAAFVSDVTIPDGTELEAGNVFTKTWRLRNAGTCTWTSDYQVVFSSGESFDADTAQSLTDVSIAPGETVDISVSLVAPESVGQYIGYWLLQNAEETNFGIGSSSGTFYVEIYVVTDGFTATPTSTDESDPTETPTPTDESNPTGTPTPTSPDETAPTETTILTSTGTSTPTPTLTPTDEVEPSPTPIPTSTFTPIPTAVPSSTSTPDDG